MKEIRVLKEVKLQNIELGEKLQAVEEERKLLKINDNDQKDEAEKLNAEIKTLQKRLQEEQNKNFTLGRYKKEIEEYRKRERMRISKSDRYVKRR